MKFWEQPIPQPSPEEVAEALAVAGIRAVSPAGAAALFNVSEHSIYRALKSGAGIRAHRVGGNLRIFVRGAMSDSGEFFAVANRMQRMSRGRKRVGKG